MTGAASVAPLGTRNRPGERRQLSFWKRFLDEREEHPLLVTDVPRQPLAEVAQVFERRLPSFDRRRPTPNLDVLDEDTNNRLVVRGATVSLAVFRTRDIVS